jgi:hypothetical protein
MTVKGTTPTRIDVRFSAAVGARDGVIGRQLVDS